MLTSKPTFRQQYDKIVGAYLRGELNPTECEACFVGNLMNGNQAWANLRSILGKVDLCPSWREQFPEVWAELIASITECMGQYSFFYTQQEVVDIETVFLTELMLGVTSFGYNHGICCGELYPESYEERLFNAMEAGLIALRKLHESKGEVIEDYAFTKRELQNI